jgi:ATP-binding cassette subfamily G (WHITE) protein 2 (SNQ2)
MYTLNQYFLSRNIIEIPYILLIPFLFLLISYWMVGLANTAEQFFTMYFIILMMSFAATSAGMFAGSIITDPRSFSNIVTFVTTPLLAFSGFFKNYNTMPKWIGWVRFLSPFNYSFTALVGNETHYKPGRVDEMNFEMSTWTAILILFCLGIGLRLLSYLLLALRKGKLQ